MKIASIVSIFLLAFFAEATAANAQSRAPSADPAMNEELMGRLIDRTLASKVEGNLDPKICAIFAICKSGQHVKTISSPNFDGLHLFTVFQKPGSKDILVGLNTGRVTELYLTDKSGVLRAAAVGDRGSTLRLIAKEQAAKNYKYEMQYLARAAEARLRPSTGGAAGR